MRVVADWLEDAPAQTVTHLLEAAGHQALFVGGCVRNALIDAPVADLDLSTDAHPPRVMDLAQTAGLRVVPTGIDHGTVTVVVDGTPIEVTTFRRDVETDGRRATVAFAETVREDAGRRDFTMNALYCDARGEIVDPLGGLPDLQARYLRFVGHATDRVREDYLRILRFFRFHAWYADQSLGFDPEALDACARHADGLTRISAERIGAELTKLLTAPDPVMAVATMRTSGVLATVLAGADDTALGPLVHLERAANLGTDPMTRLAALTQSDVAKPLRLSKSASRHHAAIAQAARDDAPPRTLGYRLGTASGQQALVLRAALMGQTVPTPALRDVAEGAKATFPIAAKDLADQYSGPALGARLKLLERLWLDSGQTAEKSALLNAPNPTKDAPSTDP